MYLVFLSSVTCDFVKPKQLFMFKFWNSNDVDFCMICYFAMNIRMHCIINICIDMLIKETNATCQ